MSQPFEMEANEAEGERVEDPFGTQLIHECFEKVAVQNAQSVAIVHHAHSSQLSWTYAEMNGKANELATRILRETGGVAEAPVIILLEDRVEILIASISALKAGAAFIPLSSASNTAERLAHCVRQLGLSQLPIIITENETLMNELCHLNFKSLSFTISGDKFEKEERRGVVVAPPVTPSSLAYIIFTSGSTGTPKGVMVEHGSLVSKISWFIREYGLDESDRGVLFLNPAFDASLLESWALLLAGGTLFVLPDSVRGDARSFMEFVREKALTRLVLPACFAEAIWKLEGDKEESLKMPHSLKTAFVGGEQISAGFTPSFFRSLTYDVINSYGPTETTVQATAMNLAKESYEGELPPIGFPIAGAKLRVKNEQGADVGAGDEGELWIGGNGLARGYLNNPSMTNSKFLYVKEEGSSGGERWYCTGDVVRQCDKTGAYHWLRRVDDQVKVNGYLIEPAEVERLITQQLVEKIVSVKVLVIGKRIVAFLVYRESGKKERQKMESSSELRRLLCPHISAYMLPSFFIPLDSVPVTPNGKVDKKQLEKDFQSYLSGLERELSGGDEGAASNSSLVGQLEKSVASLWSRVLNLPSSVISASHDIFQLGGDSLQLTEIRALLKTQFGMTLPNSFLQQGNKEMGVKNLAQMLANKMDGDKAPPPTPPAHLIPMGKSREDKGQPASNRIFVFLHPEAGTLYCYSALVHNLRDLSGAFWGLVDPSLSGATSSPSLLSFSSLKEMAKAYVSTLNSQFPADSQYILCGYGFGGHLAWEMSAILGASVPFLALFETKFPTTEERSETEQSLVESYERGRSIHNVGVRVPPSVVSLGSDNYRLGLRHRAPSSLTHHGTQILLCTSTQGTEEEGQRWASFVGPNCTLHFHEIGKKSESECLLEEPHVQLVATIMRSFIVNSPSPIHSNIEI